MIGGATTSKAHTAVKLIQNIKCGNSRGMIPLARAVGVVSSLLSNRNAEYVSDLKTDYADFREKFLNRQVDKEYITIEEVRNQKFKIDWEKRKKLFQKKTNWHSNQEIFLKKIMKIKI